MVFSHFFQQENQENHITYKDIQFPLKFLTYKSRVDLLSIELRSGLKDRLIQMSILLFKVKKKTLKKNTVVDKSQNINRKTANIFTIFNTLRT